MKSLLAAAVRVHDTADVALACRGIAATAAGVGSAADVALACRGSATTAVWVSYAANVAPEEGQLGPELAQGRWIGGAAVLQRRRVAPGCGEKNAKDEQHSGTATEGSTHDGSFRGSARRHGLHWPSGAASRYAYGARSDPGKVHENWSNGDILPNGSHK